MNISACIITNNNRDVLKAIQSVKSSCNEIILVETSGRNNFQSELNDLGVKLYWKSFSDDFSDVRNFSLSLATGDYIFVIDSDEVLKTEIKFINDEYDYFFAKIYNGDLMHYFVRLFKNNIGIKFFNKIHENLNYNDFKGAISDIEINHTGYLNTENVNEKQIRNMRILETDITNVGRNYYLLCGHYHLKNIETAIEYGLKCLNDNIGKEIKANASLMLYELYQSKKDTTNAMIHLANSLEYLPEQSRGRLHFINHLIEKNQKDLLINELNNLMHVTKRKKSFLPNDKYLSESEITELLNKANLIN